MCFDPERCSQSSQPSCPAVLRTPIASAAMGRDATQVRQVRQVLDVLARSEAFLSERFRRRLRMSITHYDSYTDARAHLKDLLDAAERGRVATVRRDAG